MTSTAKYRLVLALLFLSVMITPMVTQHCLALEHLAIEWTGFDDTEKESSKKLLDDLTKDWISYSLIDHRVFPLEEFSGLNAGYFLNPQQELFSVILDPPEYNRA